MDRNRKGKNRNQRSKIKDDYSNSVLEHEYHMADDHEEVLNVRILPARPIDAEREYADRALPRSTSAQSLSSLSSANSNSLPRDFSLTSGPAVNRALKPGRRKKDKKLPPVQPEDQHSHRRSPSPPAVITELVSHLPGLTVHDSSRRDRQRATKKAEFSAHGKGLQSAEHVSTLHTNHRHSLDLETHDLETRSQLSIERVPSKRLHHEWPQTKEDFNQHDFVPMEKPQQTYCEEDWYVGTCTRADAEHALHLVNKDGAFLVRDCSINSNSEPLVLAMYHGKKVYNVKIRFIESTSKYALGRGHRSNDMFDSVAEIIKFHSIFPVILISGRNMPASKCPENCVLTCPVTRSDVEQLLQ
ncbi:cytokine-dependent hematopoietic cell linker isoform X1 [Trematomus bernacchii]|uniref:cytokine-dependent hematopoietic cell linker isoform X1 n=1 Tax=Trematomus bernacchii TaxID=40690 RepID=UPI00146CFAD1|nr:cytokine-dependent hematopoietic cell linker isoform X1 [Trematomus bernacchii]